MIDPAQKFEVACPLTGKLCVDGSREDFPKNKAGGLVKCRWWQHLAGKDPQSEKMLDQFDCSIAWLPIVGVEGAQMSRQTASSVDKVSNEMATVKSGLTALSGSIRLAASEIRQGIENGSLHVLLAPPHEKANGGHDA